MNQPTAAYAQAVIRALSRDAGQRKAGFNTLTHMVLSQTTTRGKEGQEDLVQLLHVAAEVAEELEAFGLLALLVDLLPAEAWKPVIEGPRIQLALCTHADRPASPYAQWMFWNLAAVTWCHGLLLLPLSVCLEAWEEMFRMIEVTHKTPRDTLALVAALAGQRTVWRSGPSAWKILRFLGNKIVAAGEPTEGTSRPIHDLGAVQDVFMTCFEGCRAQERAAVVACLPDTETPAPTALAREMVSVAKQNPSNACAVFAVAGIVASDPEWACATLMPALHSVALKALWNGSVGVALAGGAMWRHMATVPAGWEALCSYETLGTFALLLGGGMDIKRVVRGCVIDLISGGVLRLPTFIRRRFHETGLAKTLEEDTDEGFPVHWLKLDSCGGFVRASRSSSPPVPPPTRGSSTQRSSTAATREPRRRQEPAGGGRVAPPPSPASSSAASSARRSPRHPRWVRTLRRFRRSPPYSSSPSSSSGSSSSSSVWAPLDRAIS